MPVLTPDRISSAVLHSLFVLSGVAAILYQVMWQRTLLGIYGTHADSVTIVVAAFMLGLGCGNLVGGRLAGWSRVPPPVLFAWIECAIALYGVMSIALFRWLGAATDTAPAAGVWGMVFALLLVPTTMMGATLPMLTAFLVQRSATVGRAVGGLYAANTLGSSCGALAAALVLAGALGQHGSVLVAAGLNLTVGAGMWATRRLWDPA